jgi:hypothetical protein
MADIVVDGNTTIWWVTTISNPAAPTASEITAGVKISQVVRADGVENFTVSANRVDTTSIESTAETSVVGRVTFGDSALVCKKQSGTDTVYTALGTPQTSGYVVMRFGYAPTVAAAAAQKVDVYSVQTGPVGPVIEQGQVVRYRVPTPIGAVPNNQVALT